MLSVTGVYVAATSLHLAAPGVQAVLCWQAALHFGPCRHEVPHL